jgi:hypothetical protein
VLTSDQLDALVDPVTELYRLYGDSVINDIARRLAGLDYARPTAAWQAQRLQQSGMLYEDILARLSELTGKSEKELRRMFERAGVKAMRFDDSVYKAAGLNPLPLNLSPQMARVLAAGLRKTNGMIQNLTMTTAAAGQNAFLAAADMAYMQVSTGVADYGSAIRSAVKSVAADGLSVVNYASGRVDQLDVAMRRAVLTGVNQTVGNLQIARADEMGVDLVQTSAHAGARPSHQVWQGKVFSRSGAPGYPDFVTETGYGTGAGLCGWNCRHSFYPFFEGISENAYRAAELEAYADQTVTYQGKTISFYDATQEQRAIERKIRYWKRQAGALKAAGLDASQETAKVKAWQAQMRAFTRETGLMRQPEREWVLRGGASKTSSTAKLVAPKPKPEAYKVFENREQADSWGFEQSGINPELTNSQHEALRDYKISGTYRGINQYLRTGVSDADWTPEIKQIDQAFHKSALPENVTAYRGMPANLFPERDMTGAVISDKAYLSTSISKQTGEKYALWANEYGDGQGLVVIDIPKNYPALWMEGYWKTSLESELLLPRDTMMKVISDTIVNNVRIIRVQVLP